MKYYVFEKVKQGACFMDLIESFKQKARSYNKTIVLPEGNDPRTIKAADVALKEGLAKLIILGNEEIIAKLAKEQNADLSKAQIIDPKKSPKLKEISEKFYELRKSKGITPEQALKTVEDEVYFGTMLVQLGEADGLVSGAAHSTADTIRPALQIIKTAPGVSLVSSYFIMIVPNCEYGDNGLFIYSDCGLNPNPNAQELAEIAITSAHTAKTLCNMEPKVAMLSYSTKGSAKHELVDKVIEATSIAKAKAPDLALDGEFQLDAALVPEIAKSKAPGSNVAGKANILIFPDLQAGNIGYKLTERLAKAVALGPLLQGLNKPVNDLSRGCSADDIVKVIAITAVQSGPNK